MKIALIMPGRKTRRPWLSPGSLLEVAGMTPPEHEVVIYDEIAKGPLTEKTLPRADLYGLGGLSTSRWRSYILALTIRHLGGQVIAGGMDVTGHYAEGNESELLAIYNSIVVGRLTTRLWQEVLADATNHRLKKVYQANTNDPWEFVTPRYDLINPKRYFLPASVRSSAGCTEKCPFCTVHLVGGQEVRLTPLEILEAGLQRLPHSMVMVDTSDSFGCDYDHTMEVLQLYKRYRRRWFTEITIKNLMGHNGSPPLLEPMRQSGCAGVYIGVESIDQAVSGKSLRLPEVEKAIYEAHRAGLIVLASLILDVTGKETTDDIKRIIAWVIEQRLEFAQYSLVALLPGSVLRKRAIETGQIIDNNPEHMDGAWPTVWHPLPAQDRIKLLAWAYEETYSKASIRQRLQHLRGWKHGIAWLANQQIHRTAQRWRDHFNYQHWLNTRDISLYSGSDPI